LLETLETKIRDIEAIERDNPKPFGFWNIFLQTIIWTLVNVFLHVTIGLYLAHWLQKKLRGNTVYRGLLMLPWTVPSLVAAFSWRLIFDYPDGFLNRILEVFGGSPQNFMSDQWVLTACIIVNVWVGVPFMMITMLGGLQTIPEEQYEAASIDGANAFQKFVNVTLPGLRPVALVAILLGIIWTFNQFNIIYLVTLGSELKSRNILVTYAYDAFNKYFNYAEAATYGVVILSLLLAFGSYYTRILRKGGEL
jgi:arabinogalactan oligomer/maltooligosaccharide transport system permease protein